MFNMFKWVDRGDTSHGFSGNWEYVGLCYNRGSPSHHGCFNTKIRSNDSWMRTGGTPMTKRKPPWLCSPVPCRNLQSEVMAKPSHISDITLTCRGLSENGCIDMYRCSCDWLMDWHLFIAYICFIVIILFVSRVFHWTMLPLFYFHMPITLW